jgi:hypothetical protein
MSFNTEPQLTPENGNEHVVNAPRAAGASAPEAGVHPAVAEFRQRFLTESRLGFLMALGEEPLEKAGRADGSAGSSVCASAKPGGLLLAADVAPYQRLRQGPERNTAKKRC